MISFCFLFVVQTVPFSDHVGDPDKLPPKPSYSKSINFSHSEYDNDDDFSHSPQPRYSISTNSNASTGSTSSRPTPITTGSSLAVSSGQSGSYSTSQPGSHKRIHSTSSSSLQETIELCTKSLKSDDIGTLKKALEQSLSELQKQQHHVGTLNQISKEKTAQIHQLQQQRQSSESNLLGQQPIDPAALSRATKLVSSPLLKSSNPLNPVPFGTPAVRSSTGAMIKFSEITLYQSFPCIYHEQYMMKSRKASKVFKRKGQTGFFGHLHRRFFVLQGHFLTYFKAVQYKKPSRDESLDLRHCEVQGIDKHEYGPHCIEVRTKEGAGIMTYGSLSGPAAQAAVAAAAAGGSISPSLAGMSGAGAGTGAGGAPLVGVLRNLSYLLFADDDISKQVWLQLLVKASQSD